MTTGEGRLCSLNNQLPPLPIAGPNNQPHLFAAMELAQLIAERDPPTFFQSHRTAGRFFPPCNAGTGRQTRAFQPVVRSSVANNANRIVRGSYSEFS